MFDLVWLQSHGNKLILAVIFDIFV